jgi:hypothetical protein
MNLKNPISIESYVIYSFGQVLGECESGQCVLFPFSRTFILGNVGHYYISRVGLSIIIHVYLSGVSRIVEHLDPYVDKINGFRLRR